MKLLVILFVLLNLSTLPSVAADWSPWYKLDDGALNGIEFSRRDNCPPGGGVICRHWWRFSSAYETPVEIEYTIAWDNGSGLQKKSERIKLQPGANETEQFSLNGIALDEVTVRLIADQKLLAAARKEVDDERRRQEEERQRKEETARQAELARKAAQEKQAKLDRAASRPWLSGEPAEVTNRREELRRWAEYQRQQAEQARIQAELDLQRAEQEREREERREEQARLDREQERRDEAQQRREEREERRQMEADNRRQQQEQDRQFKAGVQEAMKSWTGDDPISQARKQQDRNFEAQREQMRQREEDRRREQAEQRRQQQAQAESDKRDREEERNRQAQQDRRDREAREQAERDRTQRAEETRQAQQVATEAKQKKEAAAKAEAERKRKENEGTWETGDFKVTAWGSDSLYLKSDTILAHVTNSAGEATFNGTFVKLENRYKNHSIDYSVSNSNHTNRTLKPGEKVIVPLNLPFDPKRTTEVVVRIRYWKGVHDGG